MFLKDKVGYIDIIVIIGVSVGVCVMRWIVEGGEFWIKDMRICLLMMIFC